MKRIEKINSKEALISHISRGNKAKYLCFWGHTKKHATSVTKSCFSQLYPAKFEIDDIKYPTTEHYMMAEKARLFKSSSDKNHLLIEQIITASHPQKAKQLGRQVEGFTNEHWNQYRFDIVVKGNIAMNNQANNHIVNQ